ncbi:MAG TPA: ATP-binding protein [Polyangiaceae bacterium]|nr:ATP-binding protein [Polyangiaceae bacterium]
MRAVDWAKTPLGPVESWPRSLKTCVRIVLTSRQPMFVWWGPELINLYNDAYKTIVGGKHPQALGQPASVVWREIWDQVSPRAEKSMRGNEGTYDEALLLIMERNGYPEETYYTFSYSPVPGDDGQTGGLICANTDDTRKIIGERQLALLRDVAARTADARTITEVCGRAAEAMATNPRDLVFVLIYLPDSQVSGEVLTLSGASGIEPGHPAAPLRLRAELARGTLAEAAPYPVAELLKSSGARSLELSEQKLGPLPCGAWDRPPARAAGLRIPLSSGRSGLLIVGLNPFRLFDSSYQGFLELIASQLAAGIGVTQAYEDERRRAESLAELDRAKTAFFSNVSHEFRTPLTLILGPIEDALTNAPALLTGENLRAVHRNALRLLKLVNALLDFSRIEAGRARAEFRLTNLAAFTADVASAFRSAIERAGLQFQTAFSKFDDEVYVDHDMWEKIVLNLLSNALKFTFDGQIRLSLQPRGQFAELTVEDTGTGIPADALPDLFKRFQRVQGARARTHEGSGIGLALVHELIRLHGGTVGVESELGRGTRFRVLIPFGSNHLPSEQVSFTPASANLSNAPPFVQEAYRWLALPTDSPDSLTPTQLSRDTNRSTPPPALPLPREAPRILIVDDNADMREYLARLLSDRFMVETATDGAAALVAIRRSPPALILSDVMMPNLDGFGLLRILRADPALARTPVILLSARAGDEASVEGLTMGADDYLVKPFSARELLARVETHLQLASLRNSAERERAKLYAVFMQAPVPVAVLMGAELRYEVANAHYCEVVGRNVLNQTLRDSFPELGDHPIFERLEGVYKTGEAVHDPELRVALYRRGLQEDAYFNYVAQPLRDLDGRVAGVIIVASDVTDQVLSRQRVNELRSTAESASRAKDEFLSTLSHELRTPLSAIIGWSSMLVSGNVRPEQRQKALETIERNARAQARLIEDMLDLSRIEQGKLVLSVGPVEVIRVAEAAIEAVRPAAEAKGIRLQPVLDSHATIIGDADRLQQVVWNLLSNAIKFTQKGGRVQLRVRKDRSHVEITAADDGQGIEAAFLPYVFDRFRQADPSFNRRAGGLGLGLAIVRSLVELHGGTVSAHSDGHGRGATFVVRLPMAPLRADRVSPVPEQSPTEQRKSFECPPALKGLKALVVDDEPDTRALLCFLLEQCETSVTAVGGALEALAELQRANYDVLISDIGMPELDGYELIRRVRKLPVDSNGRIPAIALTAYARAEDRTQALKSGFNMHLAKPIEPGELLVVVATVTNGYQTLES